MNNPIIFQAEPFLGYSASPNRFEHVERDLFGEAHERSEWLDPETGGGATAAPIKARILWPALGFPAVIAPRQGASSNPAATDASHSICVLVLTAKPITKGEAARYLRYVPWQERHQRSIPSGQPGSFSAQELIVRPVVPASVQDDAKLAQAFSFGSGSSNSVIVSISTYVLKKYAEWGLKHLSEIRVSENASQRLANAQYNLFWNDEQSGSSSISNEMNMLLDNFARPKQQKFGLAWQSWQSSFLKEYGLEYGARHAPYKDKDKGNKPKPVEILHPVFVWRGSASTVQIGHVTDTHVSVRSDVFERNLAKQGMLIRNNPNLIEFNNWNKSFEILYGHAKASSDVILLTGDLIDYGRGHIGRDNSGKDLGEDANYHEDRNWFLFYYLLAGNDPLNRAGRYTVPVYTTLGNHDWRLNPYPPFAPGSEDPEAFIHNYHKFDKAEDRPEIMRCAHGAGHEREYSYRLDVNKHVKGWIDRIPVLRQAAAAYRMARTAAKVGLRNTSYAVWGLLVSHNLDIKGTPLETTPESVAWYLLLINPVLDYQFQLPGGHQFLMLDWAEDEEVKNFEDGKSQGVRAAKCLTSLQRWHVAGFMASPGKAKTIGIHMPPIGPRGEWTMQELAAGARAYTTGAPPKVAWEPMQSPSFPLLAIAPQGFFKWLAASYGSFLRDRNWFVESLAKPRHGVRLVFSGHIHRAGCLVVSPVTLKIPKKGWPRPEEHRVLKVASISPESFPQILGPAYGPLYVNTTSAGPKGVQNFGQGDSHAWPGFTLVRLASSGAIVAIWQGLVPPAKWRTAVSSPARQEVSDAELAGEYDRSEALLAT